MLTLLVLYIAVINAATFAAFATDKRAARHRVWRTSEARLLALAAFGGSPAALVGQQLLRHKTRKAPFRTLLWVIVVAQVAILLFVAYRLAR